MAAASGLAHAGNTVDVTVKGTIKPAITCTPTVSTNTIDYGNIDANTIDKTKATVLSEKLFSFNVNCSDAAKFSVKLTDAQRASAVNEAGFINDVQSNLSGAAADNVFGLGTYSDGKANKNIGALFLKVDLQKGITGNGAKRDLLVSPTGADWTASTSPFLKGNSTGTVYSFANTGKIDPVALQDLAMNINAVAALDSKQMELKDQIDLNGKFTIEINQL